MASTLQPVAVTSKNRNKEIVELLQNTPEVSCPRTSQNQDLNDLKRKLVGCLHTKNYCCLCLSNFHALESVACNIEVIIGAQRSILPVFSILNKIFGLMAVYQNDHSAICLPCKTKVLSTYLFITETENTMKVISEYISQIDSGLNGLDNDVNEKGEPSHSNVVVILQEATVGNRIPNQPQRLPATSQIVETFANEQSIAPKFVCPLCKESKYTREGINQHIRMVHKVNRPLNTLEVNQLLNNCSKCVITSGACEQAKNLPAFQSQQNSDLNKIACLLCPYKSASKFDLIKHIDLKHSINCSYTCQYCKKTLPSNISYRNHLRRYHTKLYKCEYCDSCKYATKTRFKRHEASCIKILRPYACNKCPASYDTERKLLLHKNKHNASYPCEYCSRIFISQRRLEVHLKNHSDINGEVTESFKNKCSICKEQFDNQTDYKTHVSQHDPNDKHFCEVCQIVFDTRAQFLNHLAKYSHKVKLNPNIRKRYECDKCDYSSTIETALESHINRFHLKIKPYQCDTCSKTFTDSQKLKHHVKTHSSIKTHQCPVCDVSLCGPSALKKHLRRHTGEKPYACKECDERFLSSSRLDAHKLREHSKKTVSCPKCQAMFFCTRHMRMHFKRVHWPFKDEKFDINRVEGLSEEQVDMFRDRRIPVV